MRHLSVRSRYRLLVLCTIITLFRLLLPHESNDNVGPSFTISVPCIIRLWADRGKAAVNNPQLPTTPPPKDSNKNFFDRQKPLPPVPLPQIDKSSSNNNKKGKKEKPPYPKPGKLPSPTTPASTIQLSPDTLEKDFFTWGPRDPVSPPPKPPCKKPLRKPSPPNITDPFPLLSKNLSPFYQHLLDERISPKTSHAEEDTPLFIGFTRNWPQLLQCVLSYIAAGWPASDIYVVENTGTMHANRLGHLTLQNPFYLNHTQLSMLGVKVLITPTLLTFSQLQNYYAWTALSKNWTEYFWSHQDLMVFSFEYADNLYNQALSVLRYLRSPSSPKWANHFFSYDHLTLVNRDAILAVGGWDTHIPYYATDCDMYVRLMWAGYWQGSSEIGIILDVASVLTNVGALLRIPGIHASFSGDPGPPKESLPWWQALNSPQSTVSPENSGAYDTGIVRDDLPEVKFLKEMGKVVRNEKNVDRYGETYEHLVEVGIRMENEKYRKGAGGRNTWQTRQTGGQDEPFFRDSEGFENGLRKMIDVGREVFAEKWGHRGCDIARMGIRAEDAWKLERDWDVKTEGKGSQGGEW
ncbi:hypothetical protein B0H66DRAFT_628663 [Apodospora peruviana]|uniref:Glycosyltransferase family 34 protein n=1 Tax=Apodospora peruviana TaxID=516989 RepID=A0AAE0HZ06_9PEZI|nr:hypothetical protein B0H66DRAFT_628663 [Apodospora peruviana]